MTINRQFLNTITGVNLNYTMMSKETMIPFYIEFKKNKNSYITLEIRIVITSAKENEINFGNAGSSIS